VEPDAQALDFDPLHTLGFLARTGSRRTAGPGRRLRGRAADVQRLAAVLHGEPLPDQAEAVVDPRRLLAPVPLPPLGGRRAAEVRQVAVGRRRCCCSRASARRCSPAGPPAARSTAADHGCGCGWEYEYEPGEAMGSRGASRCSACSPTRRRRRERLRAAADDDPLRPAGRVRARPRGLHPAPEPRQDRPALGGGEVEARAAAHGRPRRRVGALHVLEQGARHLADDAPRYRRDAGPHDRAHEPVGPDGELGGPAGVRVAAPDIFRYYRKPPADLSYANKRERHKIHLYVYADSPWVDPASIDAEAAELVETDPTQAERFFGNRLVQGLGSFLTDALWESRERSQDEPERDAIASASTARSRVTGRRCAARRATGTASPRPTAPTTARRSGTLPSGEGRSPRRGHRRGRRDLRPLPRGAHVRRPAPLGDAGRPVGARARRGRRGRCGRRTRSAACSRRSTAT
jgi:hypothetical protein